MAGTDTTHRGPGPATLYQTAYESLRNGAPTTARRGFEQLVASYPDDELAPQALVRIGETYTAEGNTAAADSVNQLVYTRYPKAPAAATGLYRHAKMLWDAGKKSEARPLLNRIVNDFPNSDEAILASGLLRNRE
jgi:TolA-binding protein